MIYMIRHGQTGLNNHQAPQERGVNLTGCEYR